MGNLKKGALMVEELVRSERHWISVSQEDSFTTQISTLKKKQALSRKDHLLALNPFIDSHGILRVGGRGSHSEMSYNSRHPVILPGKHPITKLIVRTEHLRLLHAGTTLTAASLSRRYHILGSKRAVRDVVRPCVMCRRVVARPQPQFLGQLPKERLSPGLVFEHTGVDYAGPVLVRCGAKRKSTLVKAYVSVFISLTVKAVHLELVSDLTSEAFIAALRRFVSRRGKPHLLWSDNGSNFVGANCELKEMFTFLKESGVQHDISDFCSSQGINWKFIPERAPHFGGLWEAAVRSMKLHLRKVIADSKLTYEELTTVLSQVESCLNSRPLTPLHDDDDGLDILTPGHFLIGRPMEALPDPAASYQPQSLLRRWLLCQLLVRHFWQRWSSEYLSHLMKLTKWKYPSQNLQNGDLVCLHEDKFSPTVWPMGRIVDTHQGRDGLVRVVPVKTSKGEYKRPVNKVALILPAKESVC